MSSSLRLRGLVSEIARGIVSQGQQHAGGRRRVLQACVSGHITSASRCRTFASATAPAPKKEGEGRGSSYVSPHDWSSIEKQYGKADTSAALKPVEIHTITATSRTLEQQGSRYSRKIREEGLLPGVLYGPGIDGDRTRVLLTCNRFDLERQMRRLEDSILSTVFDLKVDDKYTQRVIIRDIDRDPGTGVPIAANFLRYRPGYPVKVPVCFINEELCIPLKRGGMLLSINRFIPVVCEGETIPEMLIVDLTGVRPNQKIGLDRTTFPPGCKPFGVKEKDYTLGVVKGKSIGDMGDMPAAAAAAAAGTDAAAAAAAKPAAAAAKPAAK